MQRMAITAGRLVLAGLILVSALVLVGCPDDGAPRPTLTLTAEPSEIPADGRSYTLITADTTNVPDQSSIVFGTSLGRFDEFDPETTTDYREVAGGVATIRLYAGSTPGVATVTAVVEEVLQASTTATFSGTPMPDPRNTSFTCQSENIAGFTTSGAQMECTLIVKDKGGNPLPYDALLSIVELKAEAGGFGSPLEQNADDYRDSGSVLHFEYRTGSGEQPVDVDPDDALGEPSRSKTGGTANPRDGLVTLMAVIQGSETCNGQIVDNDCSGVFDDLPEPFVDVDDDGEYTAGVDRHHVDVNGDSQYTGLNGVWDAEFPFAKSVKVLWSGPPKTDNPPTTQLLPEHADIGDGSDRQFTVTVLDANYNPPAANDGGGDMSISVDTAIMKEGSTSVKLPSTTGMTIDPSDGRVTAFLEMADSFRYRFTVADGNPDDGEVNPEDGSITIDIDGLYKGPSPMYGSGYSPDTFATVQLTATLSVD